MKHKQITSYNAWRGICAIGILFSHMYYVADSTNPLWNGFYRIIMRNGSICSTYFFLCSGFFLNYTWKSDVSFGKYIKGKLKRIYPITLIVFLGALFVNLVFSGQTNEINDYSVGSGAWIFSVVANLLLFKAFVPIEAVFYSFHGPSWYISALFGFYLTAYLFVRGLHSENKVYWSKIITGCCISAYILELIVCIYVQISGCESLWLCYVNPWFRIFGEGFVGILICEKISYSRKGKFLDTVLEVCSVALFILAFLLCNVIHLKIYSAWLQVVFMGSILLAFRNDSGAVSKILNKKPFQFLGDISFELYMTHAFIYEGLPVIAGVVGGQQYTI